MKVFKLEKDEFITLCNLLKFMDLCESGGQAKVAITDGAVKVNDVVELRKGCKIREGSIVEFSGEKIKVTK